MTDDARLQPIITVEPAPDAEPIVEHVERTPEEKDAFTVLTLRYLVQTGQLPPYAESLEQWVQVHAMATCSTVCRKAARCAARFVADARRPEFSDQEPDYARAMRRILGWPRERTEAAIRLAVAMGMATTYATAAP